MTDSTRRSLLSGIGVLAAGAVAGCLGRSGDGGNAASPTATDARETPTATDARETPTATPVADPVRWRAEFDRPPRAPAVTEDAVYVAAGDVTIGTPTESARRSGTVAALDPADGSDRWRRTTSPPPMRSPMVADGAAYVVVGGSNGYAGEANQLVKFEGGEERWRTDPVDQFLSSLAVSTDRVYLGTHDDAISDSGQRLFGVDDATGESVWSVEAGDAWGGWLQDGSLFVDVGGLELTVRDPADGSERWARSGEVLTEITGDLPTADGAAFLGVSRSDPGAFLAVEADDGSTRWRYDEVGDSSFVATGATTHDGDVIGTEYGGTVFALAAADGTERWTFSTDGDTRDPPAVVGDTVVVGDASGTVYGVDAADGTERWRVDGSEEAASPTPTADGVVVVPGDVDGAAPFRALDPAGRERWSYAPETSIASFTVTDAGLFLTTRDGTVLSLGT